MTFVPHPMAFFQSLLNQGYVKTELKHPSWLIRAFQSLLNQGYVKTDCFTGSNARAFQSLLNQGYVKTAGSASRSTRHSFQSLLNQGYVKTNTARSFLIDSSFNPF